MQLAVSDDLERNTQRICKHIADLARQGVRAALFPECATTGYFSETIPQYTQAQLKKAEDSVARVCAESDIYAIVGPPCIEDGVRYDMAPAIDPEGRTICRQAEIQWVGADRPWA